MHERERLRYLLSTYRQSIMILFLSFSAMLLSFAVRVDRIQFLGMEISRYDLPAVLLTGGMLLAVASFLNKYLDKKVSVIGNEVHYGEASETYNDLLEIQKEEQRNLLEDVSLLKARLEELYKQRNIEQANSLDENEKSELIETIKEQITSVASNEYISDIKASLVKAIDKSTKDRLEKHFLGTMKRLSNEINELGKRAKVNLIIGSVAALSGVSVFVLFVFERVSPDAVESYLITDFAPRISLVIVIEIFAYFFLGLYKSNLSEIKYFHNELTNVESRYLALEEAISLEDEDAVKEIVKDISKTERNFLLKKGESTVSTEEKRLAMEDNKNTIQHLSQMLSKK